MYALHTTITNLNKRKSGNYLNIYSYKQWVQTKFKPLIDTTLYCIIYHCMLVNLNNYH